MGPKDDAPNTSFPWCGSNSGDVKFEDAQSAHAGDGPLVIVSVVAHTSGGPTLSQQLTMLKQSYSYYPRDKWLLAGKTLVIVSDG